MMQQQSQKGNKYDEKMANYGVDGLDVNRDNRQRTEETTKTAIGARTQPIRSKPTISTCF